MNRIIIVLACALTLAGCKTPREYVNDVVAVFTVIDNDLDKAWAGIQKNCAAVETVIGDVKAVAARHGGRCKVMNAIVRAELAVDRICNGPRPSALRIASTGRAIVDAYKAVKDAQAAGC